MYGVQLFKTKTLFKVIDIGNNFIHNHHLINFGTLSTPWKDIAGWGRYIFLSFLYTANWSFVFILKKVRTKTVHKAYVIYYNRIWLSNTLNLCTNLLPIGIGHLVFNWYVFLSLNRFAGLLLPHVHITLKSCIYK